MKKSIVSAFLTAIVSVSATSVFAQAQSDQAPSRAQIKAELAALERAGYYPAYSHGPDYPLNLQEAQRKVAAQQAGSDQYGPSTDGRSEAGSR